MKNLWTVFRFELVLYWRGWVGWVIALVAVVLGIFLSANLNKENAFMWTLATELIAYLTLLLAFTTGNQIQRDKENHLDGIVMSTPAGMISYVLGKYLAGLLTLLIYATIALIACQISSIWTVGDDYFSPPLGPIVFIQFWLLLVVVPLVFAAAVTLLGISLTRGQRALVFIGIVIIWGAPVLFGQHLPDLLNLPYALSSQDPENLDSATRFALAHAHGDKNGNIEMIITPEWRAQVSHLFQTAVASDHLTTTFLLNRALFLGLGILLVIVTIYGVNRQRQGRL